MDRKQENKTLEFAKRMQNVHKIKLKFWNEIIKSLNKK